MGPSNNKFKEKILKILLIIGMTLLITIFPGSILLSILMDEKIFSVVFNIILFAFFVVGMCVVILLPVFGGLKQTIVRAKKNPITFISYNEFLDFLQKRLFQNKYEIQKTISILSNGEVIVYLKRQKNRTLTYFTIIRVPQLSEKILETANESITNTFNELYSCKTITDSVNMISVFCVDRVSTTFQKLVNSNVQQGFKNGRFLVGVSFGGKNMYIANQKGGFAIAKYKQLRKEFMNIIEYPNINN